MDQEIIISPQYKRFCSFVSNNDDEVSNTIEPWEAIPKFFFTPRLVNSLRSKEGFSKPYTWDYQWNGEHYTVVITPAQIKQKNGEYLSCFPGHTEELVEEILKKQFTLQKHGSHNPTRCESWVTFSYSKIRSELKRIGKGRDIPTIKRAIEVLNQAHLKVTRGGREIWSGSILQDLITVDRKSWLNSTESLQSARLSVLVSRSINSLTYRQCSQKLMMSCDLQLSRWLFKKLVNRYTFASPEKSYHFKFSDVLKNSALLQQSTIHKNRKKLQDALIELKERQIIHTYEEKLEFDGRRITDIVFFVWATTAFMKEQKASNRRQKLLL